MVNERNYWTGRVSRRRSLQLSGAAATAAFLAACKAPESDTGAGSAPGARATTQAGGSTGQQAAAQTATPTKGGKIVRNVAGDPVSFDPHGTISYLTVEFIDMFHAKLVRYDSRTTPPYRNGDEDRIVGELADKWESPDPSTWVFKLKQGMKFQAKEPVNGREVVAEDVKWTWDRALSPGMQVEEWAWNNYEKVEAIDKYTVKFTSKQPNGRLPIDLAAYQTWVLPREGEEKIGFKKMEGSTVGAGPWILDSYQPGSKWVGKRNPNYGPFPGAPYADELHVPIMVAQDARTTAFRGKQLDIHGPLPTEVSSIKASNPDIKWKEQILQATNTWMLTYNVNEKPFNDIRVRRAISLAFDREAWLKSPNLRAGKIESGPVTWGMGDWKLDPDKHGEAGQWFKYDVQKAKQLLSAAGYADGFDTELFQTPQYGASYMTEAELLQEFLAKIGVRAAIKNVEYSQWISQHYTGKYTGMFWGPDNLDRLTQQFLSRYASWSTRNHPVVKDPEVDRRLAAWRAISDLKKSKEAAWDLQKYFADQAYAVYRPQPFSASAWQPYLKNYEGEAEFLYDYGFRSAFMWTDPVQKG